MITDREAPTAPPRSTTTLSLSARSHRRSPRHAVEGVVAFHTGGGERLSTGRLVDLSASGLRLRTRACLAPATPVIGVIELDGSGVAMEFLGEVARVIEGDETELAVRFLHIAEPDRRRLSRALATCCRAQPAVAGGDAGTRRAATTLRLGASDLPPGGAC